MVRAGADSCYSQIVPSQHDHIDKPEPRWQAVLAFLAVGAIYLALPANLIVGPIWLLPTLLVGLLVPTVVSHRTRPAIAQSCARDSASTESPRWR